MTQLTLSALRSRNYCIGSKACIPDDVEFEPPIKNLISELKQHIGEEEQDDLPALQKALAATESESLASSFNRTNMFVPTR